MLCGLVIVVIWNVVVKWVLQLVLTVCRRWTL